MTVAEKLERHARAVSAAQLARVDGRLRALSPEHRRAVDELAERVAYRVSRCLLEQAAVDRRIEQALAAVYEGPSSARDGVEPARLDRQRGDEWPKS